jgi:uncharacterized coiled-coil protein SlyX
VEVVMPKSDYETPEELTAMIAEIDTRIAVLRDNIRQLVEQAAAFSGAADEERTSQRIADQQEQLDRLLKQRDELAQKQG